MVTFFVFYCTTIIVLRLNIYNPMKPEGSYELNLGTWEERQVAKSLIILAMAEPGENILGERFRWDAIMDPTPGWTITQPWLTDDGMAKKGILNLTFCSAESRGCKPDIVMRRSLMQMVLCDEYDICEEDDVNVPDPSQRVGEQYMVEKQEKWLHYLYPLNDIDTCSLDTTQSSLLSSEKNRRGPKK